MASLILPMLPLVAGCWGSAPDGLGPRDDTLAPCPDTPNCVHTGMRHPSGTEGLHLAPSVSGSDTMERVRAVVASMPRTTIVEASERYLHAEARSRIFRFVDDLEVLLASDGEIVVRSASRIGRRDFGVNAARVEDLRERLRDAGLIR